MWCRGSSRVLSGTVREIGCFSSLDLVKLATAFLFFLRAGEMLKVHEINTCIIRACNFVSNKEKHDQPKQLTYFSLSS